MQHIPATPLGQALAAIIQILIAAIAEHAREHPMLAGGCRASIRQLEKLIRRFDALAAEWQASQAASAPPDAARRPPSRPGLAPPTAARRGEACSPRRAAVMRARVPPARAPPTPAAHPAPLRPPPEPFRTGAAPMYAAA
jgi:hypothetical protein